MAIYKNMTLGDFTQAFDNSDNYRGKFSYPGLEALFEYLTSQENDIAFDIARIAGEWMEVVNLSEADDYEVLAVLETATGGYMVQTCSL